MPGLYRNIETHKQDTTCFPWRLAKSLYHIGNFQPSAAYPNSIPSVHFFWRLIAPPLLPFPSLLRSVFFFQINYDKGYKSIILQLNRPLDLHKLKDFISHELSMYQEHWAFKLSGGQSVVTIISFHHLRQKNAKSGWLTWSNLNQLSAACKREFANRRSHPPLGVHKDPLNLYDARPKTGKHMLGTPSISRGYVTTGAWAVCPPAKKASMISFTKSDEE